MVSRRGNPFAEKRKRLPHRALLRRDDPLRPSDALEVEAMMLSIAKGAEYLSYAGSAGEELGCRVYCFDAEEKARAMQAWLDSAGIANRPRPEPPPNYPQLKVG